MTFSCGLNFQARWCVRRVFSPRPRPIWSMPSRWMRRESPTWKTPASCCLLPSCWLMLPPRWWRQPRSTLSFVSFSVFVSPASADALTRSPQGAAANPDSEEQQQKLREAAEGLRMATNAAAQNAIKKRLVNKLEVNKIKTEASCLYTSRKSSSLILHDTMLFHTKNHHQQL